MLNNEKIMLRGLELEDLETLHDWMNDFELLKNLLRIEPGVRYFTEQWYKRIMQDARQIIFAVQDLATGSFIGCIGCRHIDWIARKAELYIYIGDESFRGKGYAKSATGLFVAYIFDYYNLNKIYLHVRCDHEAAVRLYQKVGFTEEGRFSQEVYVEGRYIDMVRMRLLRDEWRK